MGRKLFLFPHFYLINLHEEEGYKDDPNGDGNDHTEEDSGTDGMTAGRSGTRGKYHGQHTEYEGQRGHQDRAEPGSGSGDGRLYGINAFIHFYLGEFHDQNGVLGCQSDQRYQTDLEVHVVLQTEYPHAEISPESGNRQG